ncbi:glucose-6-phosphate isomerase [Psychrobacillus insolitus]|uniref:Glucose-6-phosphate isomerase n=1 Tax=Psychrobacillus insolitus TaxID=1461 RepID=A0A2W7N3N3_9BACI|nr:glucose-6-phosphate isomerase [Psychrobacillus insolitus]PZX05934.1 glucose-6-phosphate isomerase [Psychrobacillus insolitus]
MSTLKLQTNYLDAYIGQDELLLLNESVKSIHEEMHNKISTGNEFLGWLDYPLEDHSAELEKMLEIALEVRNNAKVFVVIGIGGSYLGAKAIQDALSPYFRVDESLPEVIYAGQNLSGRYMNQLLKYLKYKDVYINVISKSGTTTEPAIAFRILRKYMEEKYGEKANERIIVTTDSEKGALRELANEKGYRSFIIDEDIGGRYSVFTAVGLLPLAIQGYDIHAIMHGVKDAAIDLSEGDVITNQAYQYAAIRQLLLTKGFGVEVLASFEPALKNLHDWWQQLFGESEGKGLDGILPIAASFSTDLHSIGQYIQDGKRFLFETLLHFHEVEEDCEVPYDAQNKDQLNYLSDKSLNMINDIATQGTAMAHVEGGVPVMSIEVGTLDEYHIGYLMYFFMKACAMSAYLQGVNPFDQPGVEAYKFKMSELLGKNSEVRK